MNTNSNVYTVVYTTVICVLVAAILGFVSQSLKPMQEDNEKAETISQILTAGRFGEKEELAKKGNKAIIKMFQNELDHAALVNAEGKEVRNLDKAHAEVYSTSDLKAEGYKLSDASFEIPVYIFNNGVHVFPVYGAGLWGPIWGYVAMDASLTHIVGAYFDHASETPGLGGKIKDDPSFRAAFAGKTLNMAGSKPFEIVKGGAPAGQTNAIDAISGATMTSKGLEAAINNWLGAYKNYIQNAEEK